MTWVCLLYQGADAMTEAGPCMAQAGSMFLALSHPPVQIQLQKRRFARSRGWQQSWGGGSWRAEHV